MQVTSILALVAALAPLAAADYLADPAVTGGGDGSKASPWPALETCISSGILARLKPGDTLYLAEGYHGTASISGSNAEPIIIAAQPGKDARLSRLTVEGSGWHFKDLRLSPTFGTAYSGTIVSFGDRNEASGKIVIEGCEVFGVDDHRTLDFDGWMKINSGILMGRHAKGSEVRNCYIRNTRFALCLSAYDGVAEGNVIENFSADGIRMTRDGQRAEGNVIKHAFNTDGDGDKNHDDAIQCFLHNKGTGTMRKLVVKDNLIFGHQPGAEPNAAVNQGIGFFDGPLVEFTVTGNVVMVAHWHGVSLYDAQGCTIADNVTWNKFGGKFRPWVMLGTKLKQAKDNTVTGNHAMSFNLKQPGTTASENNPVSQEIYEKAMAERSQQLFERYGEYHAVAKRHRVTGAKVDQVPGSADKGGKGSENPAPERTRIARRTASEAAIKARTESLRQRFDDRLAQGRTLRFRSSIVRQEVAVVGRQGDFYEVEAPGMGSQMTLPLFQALKIEDAKAMSQALVEDDAEGYALAAFFCLATNDQTQASVYLSKAPDLRAEVEAAFAGE